MFKKITTTKLIVFISLFMIIFDNFTMFNNIVKVYGLSFSSLLFIFSLALIVISLIVFLLGLVSYKYTIKPIIILLLITTSFTSYFMDTYHIFIDASMIQNTLNTDINETADLFSLKLIGYILFLGLLPSYIIYKSQIEYKSFFGELFTRIKLLILTIIVIAIALFSHRTMYATFFREHKILRYYSNPIFYIYSISKYINKVLNQGDIIIKPLGLDAKQYKKTKQRKIVILVMGEAARFDRFSINGYEKKTNPLLEQENNLLSFNNVSSCGTSTAISAPCMLSIYTRKNYTYKKGATTQNVLDVLYHAGIKVFWRDNNSRWPELVNTGHYEDYKHRKCNGECRDIDMLQGLDRFINSTTKDVVIILHQMGNHGPAYYKRYPKEFEIFKPVCKTNQLEQCSKKSINNAYSNAILYTDYFLSSVIKTLQKYKNMQTAMIYLSDHGESLGENGIYLHGMPYFMAPKEQTHIPFVMWFSPSFKHSIDYDKLKTKLNNKYSQDNLFHTLLGFMNIKTKVYNKQLDIINGY